MKRAYTLILLITLLAVFAGLSFGADAAAGKDLFAKKCKVCHGENGVPPAAMQKANPKLLAMHSPEFQAHKDPDMKKAILESARHKAASKGLTEADVDNLVAFIRTLKK